MTAIDVTAVVVGLGVAFAWGRFLGYSAGYEAGSSAAFRRSVRAVRDRAKSVRRTDGRVA